MNEGLILKFRDFQWDLEKKTYIMGIVNVTPDSFSDGGIYYKKSDAVSQAHKLAADGADIIDIGGESTRPGATPISEDMEKARVIPVIEELSKDLPIPISVDTTKSQVAEAALKAGAAMVNDVSGLSFDHKMVDVVVRYQVPVVLMHMKGSPKKMQQSPFYKDLLGEIFNHLRERIYYAEKAGIARDKIVIDPGIGFGKSIEERHNLKIIKSLSYFTTLRCPLLVGLSRKAFLKEIVGEDNENRDDATASCAAIAILNGAHIIRVHNVKKAKNATLIADALKRIV